MRVNVSGSALIFSGDCSSIEIDVFLKLVPILKQFPYRHQSADVQAVADLETKILTFFVALRNDLTGWRDPTAKLSFDEVFVINPSELTAAVRIRLDPQSPW